MARRTLTYNIESEGRDNGKVFFITEMSATQAERWAIRLSMAAVSAGIDIPDGTLDAGMAGLSDMAGPALQALASIPFEIAEPLLEEMLDCVQIIPNPSKPDVKRSDIKGDIEEVRTLIELRKAVFLLHVGFYEPGSESTSAQAPG